VRAATGDTLESLGQETRADCDAPIETFTARRLITTDKSSPYYNLYLSPPFALTYERIARASSRRCAQSPEREILWSGHFVRASLDPLESGTRRSAPTSRKWTRTEGRASARR
jgi:hypothetical protein